MWDVPRGLGEDTCQLSLHYSGFSIFHTHWCPYHLTPYPLQQVWLFPPTGQVPSIWTTVLSMWWFKPLYCTLQTDEKMTDQQTNSLLRWLHPQRSQSKHLGWHFSCSPCRHCSQTPSHSSSHNPSHRPSKNPAHSASPWWSNWHHHYATPHWYSQDSVEAIPTDSIMTLQPAWRLVLYWKCLWWPGCILYQAPVAYMQWNHPDDHQDQSWSSGQLILPEQVPCPVPQQAKQIQVPQT